MSKPKSPWRSVQYSLPATRQRVLVGGDEGRSPYIAWVSGYGVWCSDPHRVDMQPTHWMPIPPLPEEDK